MRGQIVRTGVLVLVLVGSWQLPVQVAQAEEPASPLSDGEARKRKAELQRRAAEWWKVRTQVQGRCPRCHGEGTVVEVVAGIGGGRRRVSCGTCETRGHYTYPKLFRKLYYEMMSPDFRRRPGVREALERAFRQTSRREPWTAGDTSTLGYTSWDLMVEDDHVAGLLVIRSFRIHSVELHGPAHAIVRVVLEKDTITRDHLWVWGKEELGSARPTWFVYCEAADGRWPAPEDLVPKDEAPAPEPPPQAPDVKPSADGATLEPLAPEDAKAILEVAEAPAHPFSVVEMGLRRGVVVMRLRAKEKLGATTARRYLDECVVAVSRAVMETRGAAAGIECVWSWPFKDIYGNVEDRPAFTTSMDRDTFDRAVWKNLSPEERKQLFRWQSHESEDWKPFG